MGHPGRLGNAVFRHEEILCSVTPNNSDEHFVAL
jgi:hypothetical protein